MLQQNIYINANQETIWNMLIDVENWHQWDKDVLSAKLHGPFTAGTKGILISIDNNSSYFFITEINKFNFYSNYYQLPFFTKLKFTHKIEPQENNCKVTFIATFTGPLSWYFFLKQRKNIKTVMQNALKNLSNYLHPHPGPLPQ